MVARRNTVPAIAIQWQPANRASVAIEALQVTPRRAGAIASLANPCVRFARCGGVLLTLAGVGLRVRKGTGLRGQLGSQYVLSPAHF